MKFQVVESLMAKFRPKPSLYSPASLIEPPWYSASPGKKSQGSKSAVQVIGDKGQGQEPRNG